MRMLFIISKFELIRILKKPLFWSVFVWPLIVLFSMYSVFLPGMIKYSRIPIVIAAIIFTLNSLICVVVFPIFMSSKTTRISEFILSMSNKHDQYYGKLLTSIIIQILADAVTLYVLIFLNDKITLFNLDDISNMLILKSIIGGVIFIYFLSITIGNIGFFINNEEKLQLAAFIFILILNLIIGTGMYFSTGVPCISYILPGFGGISGIYANNFMWIGIIITQIIFLFIYQNWSFKYYCKNIFNYS